MDVSIPMVIRRYTFMQKFEWDNDVPDFGKPVPADESVNCPSDTGWIVSTQPTLRKSLAVYPNPAHDLLNIELPKNSTRANLKVTNLMGQILIDEDVIKPQLDISLLPDGLYFLNVHSGKEQFMGSFLKQSG